MVTTIEQLEKVFDDVLLLADRGVVRTICATVIGNRITPDPIWLMLVSQPSGGKSECITSLDDLDFVIPISTITTNTFASGMKRLDKETSLLHRANGGMLAFKDFTSIISLPMETRKAIMGQMREIYDGKFNKETGNGEGVNWIGKVGVIAGSTYIIYHAMQDQQAMEMGERFVNYIIKQPNRIEVAERALFNAPDMPQKRKELREAMHDYITYMLSTINVSHAVIDDNTKRDILRVIDFATRARSSVRYNERMQQVEYVPPHEMPMRFTAQVTNLAAALQVMSGGELTNDDKNILYKIALDSIPPTRRMVLQALTKYSMVGTDMLAIKLHYETSVIHRWLAELDALGLVEREARGVGKASAWGLTPENREIMSYFEGIEMSQDTLESIDVDAVIFERHDALLEQAAQEAKSKKFKLDI